MERLICDCGSTKADWILVDDEMVVRKRFSTQGLNPSVDDKDTVRRKLSAVVNYVDRHPGAIQFYGAGCANDEVNTIVSNELKEILGQDVDVVVGSDMLGAAKAVCGRTPGIVCILGTGSNSCKFDGSKIVDNVAPLGYILGDEGSGASIGKALVSGIFKRCFSNGLTKEFNSSFGLTVGDVVENVYRRPSANAWLASFVPFVAERIDSFPELESLVESQFTMFIERNVSRYEDYASIPVNFVGSLAIVFRKQLQRACRKSDIKMGEMLARPLDNVAGFAN